MTPESIENLKIRIKGQVFTDYLSRTLYATDGSVYRVFPDMVFYPKTPSDIQEIIKFAQKNKMPIIPRTAGTSLAGQVVGKGIVVDVSKNFTRILNLDIEKKTVTVQPGVVRDQLNDYLKPHGLFFGPNTSTSNRCMIGGMVGNNSSGTTSIKYGVTRDKVLKLKGFMADGTAMTFEELDKKTFFEKANTKSKEGKIYQTLYQMLTNPLNVAEIKKQFPKASIHRRNTGYALDSLLENEIFSDSSSPFNLCKLLAGSEGTLFFTTEITLKLDDLPPPHTVMVVPHFNTISDCMKAVVLAMKHDLFACEMLDKVILDCTKNNRQQALNRFFIEGDPKAILMLEICGKTKEEAERQAEELLKELEKSGLSYAQPVLSGTQIGQANELRKAGLGLLGNMVGDKKAVACIEDTAVDVSDLPAYIDAFSKIMKKYGQEAVYYAHAGAGELHLRPILNLKKPEDVKMFRAITQEVALLVKSFNGAMSGEHGDGIVRSEFIPQLVGDTVYSLFKEIKNIFDPKGLFNPGKIVDAYPMDKSLRYETGRAEPKVDTFMDFSDTEGILRMAENCNGSGDCRKLPESGGTMCPSYRATRMEKDTTRARANALREFLTNNVTSNPFGRAELKEVFDLCLSCKGCASECPSNVDVAALKAEFLYQHQKIHCTDLRSRFIAKNNTLNQWGYYFRPLTNFILKNPATATFIKKTLKISRNRDLPLLSRRKFSAHIRKFRKKAKTNASGKKLIFFIDEFTQYLDAEVGKDAVELLLALGYNVFFVRHKESGRAYISKGLLEEAKKIANFNVNTLSKMVSSNIPIVGVEPSAILTLRDEYLRLADDKDAAKELAAHTYVLEEFLKKEIDAGRIKSDQFTEQEAVVKIHGHCHQKALSGISATFEVLNLPKNYKVTVIPSGCCGMAGSFGYEEEHFHLSMTIGELTLFPSVRKSKPDTIIAAAGTSCRHQIWDGTRRKALHPVTILRRALA